jgi:OOP family OmpA-OmpF porin
MGNGVITMHKRLLSVALSTAFIGGCSSMQKDMIVDTDTVQQASGYLVDSDGNLIKSASGDCILNGSWSEASIIEACDPTSTLASSKQTPAPVVPKVAPVTTPLPEAKPVQTEAEQAPVLETVILSSRAFFSHNAEALSSKGDNAMRQLIAKLGDYSTIEKIEIIGYTDSHGSNKYNMQLSQKRADTIKGFIVDTYADADISVIGAGESNPVASNNTAEGRQQNRRVEIRVTAKMVKKAA